MKNCGIICEYNPLHTGHVRQLQFAKQHSQSVICVMSGDFTQRGTPCVNDKFVRARHAIYAGADLVIELPVVFATASAENFAYGAIRILDELKCDGICFGSECDDLQLLQKCADALNNPTVQFNSAVKSNMMNGCSYPSAVSKALLNLDERFALMDKPNNVLAVEYLKHIQQFKSQLTPLLIKRNSDYNSASLQGEYCSSGAIRDKLCKGDLSGLERYLPQYVLNDCTTPVYDKYKQYVYTFFNTVTNQYLSNIEGVSEGIENRILNGCGVGSYDKMIDKVKTKRYTLVKVQRILLNSVLNITKQTVALAKQCRPYAKVLAVNKNRLDLLTLIARAPISTVSKLTDDQKQIHQIDLTASNLYSSLCGEPGNKDLTLALQKV